MGKSRPLAQARTFLSLAETVEKHFFPPLPSASPFNQTKLRENESGTKLLRRDTAVRQAGSQDIWR